MAGGASRKRSAERRLEETLTFIAQRNAGPPDVFLGSLARHLGQILDVDFVIVDRLGDEAGTAETAALFARGKLEPAIRYELAGTPCDNVLGKKLCVYASNVQAQVPGSSTVAPMGIEATSGCRYGIRRASRSA